MDSNAMAWQHARLDSDSGVQKIHSFLLLFGNQLLHGLTTNGLFGGKFDKQAIAPFTVCFMPGKPSVASVR